MKLAIVWFVAAGVLFLAWLLSLNGPNAPSSVWMFFCAIAFFVVGCSQIAIGRGRRDRD